jgi:23S rRNA G2069 N7-methylase RlmK/C1962 C5-methylase RlmI
MSVEARAEMLANRVRKRARHLRRWARREGVSCYRLYDRDIPEIPLAIDWYEGRLHVARYRRAGDEDDPGAAPAATRALAAAVAAALKVPPDRVYVKERRRQKGSDQYERFGAAGERFTVTEAGHRFWVNLADYLDTGLFLDHRLTRALVASEAAGTRFLNLFCYTASFTVYAARAGAVSSTSVDLSNTYLDWARDNLALNDIDPLRHPLRRGDVLSLLDTGELGTFDLAVLDPPTFSNSKKMAEALDVKRDYPRLVNGTLGCLRRGGVLYFSSNARKLTIDPALIDGEVADITARTIPDDFAGRASHRCWRIVRR